MKRVFVPFFCLFALLLAACTPSTEFDEKNGHQDRRGNDGRNDGRPLSRYAHV